MRGMLPEVAVVGVRAGEGAGGLGVTGSVCLDLWGYFGYLSLAPPSALCWVLLRASSSAPCCKSLCVLPPSPSSPSGPCPSGLAHPVGPRGWGFWDLPRVISSPQPAWRGWPSRCGRGQLPGLHSCQWGGPGWAGACLCGRSPPLPRRALAGRSGRLLRPCWDAPRAMGLGCRAEACGDRPVWARPAPRVSVSPSHPCSLRPPALLVELWRREGLTLFRGADITHDVSPSGFVSLLACWCGSEPRPRLLEAGD